jgi:hypothetical protein
VWRAMSSAASHQTIVRAKPEFLRHLMAELAGNAHISFEGDLSHSRFIDDLVLTRDETPMLKRNTLAPTHDFIVLRLANETIEPIFRQIQAAGRAILHVQIERDAVLQLGALRYLPRRVRRNGATCWPSISG